jgi:hypothetical protein
MRHQYIELKRADASSKMMRCTLEELQPGTIDVRASLSKARGTYKEAPDMLKTIMEVEVKSEDLQISTLY